MIDEPSDVLGFNLKRAIKALNRKVRRGKKARGLGPKSTYSKEERVAVVEIWKRSKQPCGRLPKSTIPD